MPCIVTKLFRLPATVALVAMVSLSACATPPTDPDELAAYKENNDPLEPMNRYFFEVNYAIDELFLKPVASWYDAILPKPVEHSVHNFLRNLNGPVILANDLFQGNGKRAGITAKRFLINSTLGVAGLFDVAADWFGITYHDEDFGQTLAVWGVPKGPYLVIPLLGPSTVRDTGGLMVDSALTPTWYFVDTVITAVTAGSRMVETVNARSLVLEDVDRAREASFDFYSFVRHAYLQRREALIRDQKETRESDDSLYFPDETPK